MKQGVKYILDRPLLFSIGIIFVAIALTFVPLAPLIKEICGEQLAAYIEGIIEQTAVSIVLIILLKKLGLLDEAGFKSKIKDLWVVWPMVLFILLSASNFLAGSIKIDVTRPLVIALFVVLNLSTGLFEETLCRGVVLTTMLNKWGRTKGGCYLSVLLSSLLFGMAHFVHLILGDASLLAVVTQVIYATFIGVFFCGCVIRCKCIYPVMIFHGMINMASSLNEIAVNGGINKGYGTMPIEVAITLVAMVLPFMLYGLFIIRKEFRKPMIAGSVE